MTAIEIVELRTGATSEEAGKYVSLADGMVREFLRYDEEESISRFSSTVAEVAGALYLADKARAAAQAGGAMKSQSFSEGGVSVSETYFSGGEAQASYLSQAGEALGKIARYRRANVVALEPEEPTDGADTE